MYVIGSGRHDKFYKIPSIDAAYQVSVHLAERFRREDCLEINQSETRITYGGHVS